MLSHLASHMAFPSFLLLLTTLLISLHPTSSAKGSPDLIQQTCKNTKYYDLCVSSLKSDNSSTNADTKGLALIMVKLGMANATATNSYLSTKMVSAANDPLTRKVMRDCAGKYAAADDALQNAVQDLSDEVYDYAYIHVMAAADYPNACHNAFRKYPGLVYPQELAVREDGLKSICDVVLGIINALSF